MPACKHGLPSRGFFRHPCPRPACPIPISPRPSKPPGRTAPASSARPQGAVREAVEAALDLLDSGKARVAEKSGNGDWVVNQWLKKAVLLSFRLNDMAPITGGPGGAPWWDKVPSKFAGWGEAEFRAAGFRAVPGCYRPPRRLHRAGRRADAELRQHRRLCRRGHDGRHLGRRSAPARRSARTCHISGGAGIGGVLEPLQANPVDHRGRLLHRRPLRGGRGRHRRRGRGALDGRLSSAPPPRSSTAPPARSSTAACRPIRWWSPGTMPGKPCRTAPGPGPLLRGDRQARRCRTRSKTTINELLRT